MRIAVSQRVHEIPAYRERRDCIDQRWAHVLESLGLVPVPLPNGLQDPQRWALELCVQGLLLTGGNDPGHAPGAADVAPERDRSETVLLDLAHANGLPVLGVCRGLQVLNGYCGGGLGRLPGHVASRHRLRRSGAAARLLGFLPDGVEVNSFHGLGIAAADIAAPLLPVLLDDAGYVEAAEHRHLRWAGIMWHPEREPALTALDRQLLTSIFQTP